MKLQVYCASGPDVYLVYDVILGPLTIAVCIMPLFENNKPIHSTWLSAFHIKNNQFKVPITPTYNKHNNNRNAIIHKQLC